MNERYDQTPSIEIVSPIFWPRHNFGLTVEHNIHLICNETIEEALYELSTYEPMGFPDKEEIDLAIATNSVWTIQWYPDNSDESYKVHASTFEKALAQAIEGQSEIDRKGEKIKDV